MGSQRFVVQEHTTPEGVHWDLMLEAGEILITFRLAEPPEEAVRHPVDATRIFDHPLRFLTYEGPVQNGTGRVRIVERGTYACADRREDRWALALTGSVLSGHFTLARMDGGRWCFAVEEPKAHA